MNKLIQPHAFRLLSGEDLRKGIEAVAQEKGIKAGCILTAVGSLTEYNLRLANQSFGTSGKGHFEIVSITGTISVNGSHIHISISDGTGHTIGGHLLDGCKIYTTAEIVIAILPHYEFAREQDDVTGYKELRIYQK
jgi:predicted DNA-binding protein with PD1-like motif